MATVTVNEVSLEYEWWGSPSERPPVLLLHEAMGSVKAWGDFPRLLAEALRCRVYAYSRQGAGRSEPLIDGLGPDYLEKEALEVLPALRETLRLPEVVLVGVQEGATIALVHAGGAVAPTVAVAAIAPVLFVEPALRESIEGMMAQFVSVGASVFDAPSDPQKTFAAWSRLWRDPARDAWQVDDFLRGITCPTLLARGDVDEFTTQAQLDRASALIHDARLVSLAGCRHLPHLEKPGVLTEALTWFLGQP
ncbi:MAG: alpha/beta hydrolase [Myxococcota bacterium]